MLASMLEIGAFVCTRLGSDTVPGVSLTRLTNASNGFQANLEPML